MRTLVQWFDEYGESHRNPTNKLIHYICVPAITFSVLGLLWACHPFIALLAIAGSLYFYSRLSMPLTGVMAMAMVLMIGILTLIPHLLVVSLVIFVVAWIGQVIGHRLEGKRPSFFQDLAFLLIGPLWVVDALLKKMNEARTPSR